ncbi:aliphatic sulfonate ABC transporter substrate-binding protein [Cytobacillus purgationiresistens]|uniref:Sulfonate transport system substrate-binding protein n=1 Tax=Cytobacillus purgationiresistens TaxID=863449 RepID=A0ABU0AMJ3_9BACI|nr:aliphatic sulfonate ABC transporter substrate-binding protein [Cytobacillus purgationiresistens]MDQ0272487.1 sulfonate transport system substrate-binding protein [Cytobacillus purgationiresistens]
MKNARNKLVLAIILLLSFVVLAACGSNGSDEATSKESKKVIKIGYQKGNTLNILKENKFLEEALEKDGYTIEWKMFVHGGALLEGLYSGAIDFGHAADGSAIFAQASGKPLVYVGADAPNPEGVGLMVLKDSGITSIEELKGKKVGVLKGGNHHYLALLALDSVGLTADDVQWVYPEDAAQGRAIFETKQVDALASYDPFFASIETELEVVTLTEGEDYDYPNRTFYFATPDFYENEPELVDQMLETIDQSDQWANENKADVAGLISKALGIDESVINKQVERRTFGASNITQEMIDAQQRQADKYFEINLIPAELDVSKDMPVK